MDLAKYSVAELKSALKRFNLKTTGTKAELIGRLSKVDEGQLSEALASQDDVNESVVESADNVSHLEEEMVRLRGLVEHLCSEMKSLRSAASHSNIASESTVVGQSSVRIETPCSSGSLSSTTHDGARNITTGNIATNRSQVNCPQIPRSSVEINSGSQQVHMNDRQQAGFSGQQFVQSPVGQYTIKDIVAVLPTYDPADDSQTSIQFVDRIERLRNVYGWNDNLLVFAVLSKLKGYAKRWVDAQQVFDCWSDFVLAFLRDFPCFRTQASAHVQLMNARMHSGESLIEYYYRVLSIGRRENIDEASIIQYIINGITDENLKRTLIVMQFGECAKLLKAMVKAAENKCRQQLAVKKPSEIVGNKNYENRDHNKDKRVVDNNRSSNNFVCYNCHQSGHISRNCMQPQRN